MRFKTTCLLLFLLAILPAMLFAEGSDTERRMGLASPGAWGMMLPQLEGGVSLLDPQRLQMSQSYGLLYSTGGKSGDLVGLYQNRLSYHFSPRLNLRVDLGYLHRPVPSLSRNATIRNQALLSAFQLDFQPIDNLFIQFNFRSLPVLDYRNSPFGFRDSWGSTGD